MTQDIEIPKISQKHLLGIKYLSIDDINKILELAIFFKLKNKEKNKKKQSFFLVRLENKDDFK